MERNAKLVVMYDERFQEALRRYTTQGGSSEAVVIAALKAAGIDPNGKTGPDDSNPI